MQDRLENGLVIRVTGGDVWVLVGSEVVACSLRGRLRVKKDALQVVAGDRVVARRDPGGSGVTLENVLPRASHLSRWVERGGVARAIVANVERLFVVASLAEPPLRPVFVDRMLAAGEWGRAPLALVLNKSDLAPADDIESWAAVYRACDYPVYPTCARTGQGLDALQTLLGKGVYAFVGESGVGKSSLLNRLDPAAEHITREVAERTGRGRHTTSSSELFPFRDGFLADTPGMQTFGFPGRDERELAACFPDIAAHEGDCRFDPCTHSHEPGCAIKAAVEAGTLAVSRHRSYLAILEEIRTHAKEQPW
ncbi:MAG TPA: ribosome small subunit-dependent GTPase A [Candidatus Krumholzibacteria bacterium]|nr:ribosome small subunit-dependent GTPase A [Candidatus Krumholzibacteria bacterium]